MSRDAAALRGALSQAVAQERARRVSDVTYRLLIDLTEGDEMFSGEVDIEFELSSNEEGVRLDFASGSIDAVSANGKAVDVQYDGYWLFVPAASLVAGSNEISVTFSQDYHVDGTGLHRFVDPEDGRTYLYTYLWPYYANQVFPLFDQPNIKAVFELTVRAPEEWVVVSAAPGAIDDANGDTAAWRFEPTPRIPSYVFSLHAGPYRIWESEAGGIPLRLMARQSLADYVQVEEWLEVTRRGFEHFQDYYEIAYPFEKYDQIIVPDFQIGGMENVGAVTFGEQYVQRQASSFEEREGRASVILHEMAHMWFGDLVTHHWWNGLWLNESFATQMAALAMAQAADFKDSWHGFFVDRKPAAYAKDSRVTTHPIEMPIAATDEFFSVFDAITYRKGASALKQLAYLVGEEHYRQGVANYLKQHAYGNTNLEDFVAAIAATSGRDLAGWSEEWLNQPGFNVVSTRYRCENGNLAELNIDQRAYREGPPARTHASQIAMYFLDGGGKLTLSAAISADFAGETTTFSPGAGSAVEWSETLPCPVLVYPNYQDFGYFRVELSEAERAIAGEHMLDLDDSFAQSMLLQSLFDATMEGEFPIAEYLAVGRNVMLGSDNLRLLTQAIKSVVAALTMLERLPPQSDGLLAHYRPQFELLGWEQIASASGSDHLHLWFDFYLSIAASPMALDRVRALLDGTIEIENLPMSDDIRWQLLMVLARLGAEDTDARLAAQSERDASDLGQKMAMAVSAGVPDLEVKRSWLPMVSDPLHESGLARQRFVMGSLLPASQTDLATQILPDILAALKKFGEGVDPYFAANYTSSLLVPVCNDEGAALYSQALEEAQGLSSTTLLFLREAEQANEECRELRDNWRVQQPGSGEMASAH